MQDRLKRAFGGVLVLLLSCLYGAGCAVQRHALAPTSSLVYASGRTVDGLSKRTVVVLTPTALEQHGRALLLEAPGVADGKADGSGLELGAADYGQAQHSVEAALIDAGFKPVSVPPGVERALADEIQRLPRGAQLSPAQTALLVARHAASETTFVLQGMRAARVDELALSEQLAQCLRAERRELIAVSVSAALVRADSGEVVWTGSVIVRATDLMTGTTAVEYRAGAGRGRCEMPASLLQVSCSSRGDSPCAVASERVDLVPRLIDHGARELVRSIRVVASSAPSSPPPAPPSASLSLVRPAPAALDTAADARSPAAAAAAVQSPSVVSSTEETLPAATE